MAKKETRHSEHFDKLSAPLVSETQNIEAPYELPEGWKWTRLGDVADFIGGGTPDKSNHDYWNGIIPWASVKDIKGKFLFSTEDTITEIGLKESATNLCEKEGLILVTRIAPGKAIISKIQTAINQDLKIIQTKENKLLLKYFFDFYEDEIKNLSSGTTVKGIKLDVLEQIPFPLPPLTEQQRIVNRIETMFAKLDQAQEKAQSVLDSFETRKAAILHKAFTGQLRIDNEELKIEDWEEKKLGEIVNGFKYGISDKCDYKNKGIPVLRIPNVGDGAVDYTDLKYSERNNIEENYIVKENDILIIRSNGSRELVGKSALYNNTDKQFSYGSFLIKITPSEVINPKYLVTFLNSDDARNQMFNKAKSSSGIHNINTKELSEIKLKLPPLNYQLSIVNFLDSVLEKETRAKEAAQTVLEQIALLKKSILARAFRGDL